MATPTINPAPGLNNEKKEEERAQHIEYLDKAQNLSTTDSDNDIEAEKESKGRLDNARDLVTEVLSLEDDPTLNPWTFRMWFIGIGMSVFAGYENHPTVKIKLTK
jgi:hypothetical protein